MQRVVKPRNQRSKRALDAREPKAIENDKTTIFVRGQKCSETVKSCMKDFHALKRPNSVMVNMLKKQIFDCFSILFECWRLFIHKAILIYLIQYTCICYQCSLILHIIFMDWVPETKNNNLTWVKSIDSMLTKIIANTS